MVVSAVYLSRGINSRQTGISNQTLQSVSSKKESVAYTSGIDSTSKLCFPVSCFILA